MLSREDVAALYENDQESFCVKRTELNTSDFEVYELMAIESMPIILNELQAELKLLEEQYQDDKEVRYVLETVDIEGLWYTMVHKFNVGSYLGPNSTCAKLAHMLKACDHVLSDLRSSDADK